MGTLPLNGDIDVNGFVDVAEQTAPATPASGRMRVYAKSDGKLYAKNDAGTEYELTGGGGGGGVYTALIGDGSSTSITVTHGLGTRAVLVGLTLAASPYTEVATSVVHATDDTITLGFPHAPASSSLRVTVIGGVSGLPAVYDVNDVAATGASETVLAATIDEVNRFVLTADCTITFPTAAVGASFVLATEQDSTGDWTVTWPGTVLWPDGVTQQPSAGIAVIDVWRFLCADGSTWIAQRLVTRASADAPPQVVQHKVGGGSGGATVTTTTIVMDAAPTEGNLLVAFVHSVGTRTCTPASGSWTNRYDVAVTDSTSLECWTHTVGAAESNSYQFDWDSTAEFNSVILVEVENWLSVDETASTTTGNADAPTGTNTFHPNLVFLHSGTDGGLVAGSALTFAEEWTTLQRHFPNYHANGVAYAYVFGTSWPTTGIINVTTANIPRAIISIASTS